MKKIDIDRRKYPRYDTELKVYFQVKYDVRTKIKFQIMTNDLEEGALHRYSGLSKNVSAEGICFASKKRLGKGDILYIEVYEPKAKGPIRMEGQVHWSRKVPGTKEGDLFRTGVRLFSVNGKPIADSIYFDKKYKVIWSAVLDSVFGTFAATKRG